MNKGFSIHISRQGTAIDSFLEEKYDDVYLKTSGFDFLLEGVLLNKTKLLQQHAAADFAELIRTLYADKKHLAINELEGEIRGFIFDKTAGKLFVFTNITATQRVFYGVFDNEIFIDTQLVRLNDKLRAAGHHTTPDLESVYQLLCFTNLAEARTPLLGVSKLADGHFLEIDCQTVNLSVNEYFRPNTAPTYSGTKSSALDAIHDVFSEAVRAEYQKDTEFDKGHLALLSGGLDSRVALFYAVKNAQKPDLAFCFSQSGYLDHTISEKIAADQNIPYQFVPLDGGKFLNKIDELTEISEGMVLYTGGIHVQHALEHLQFENFGGFHSGQIGDGVLGGFNSAPRRQKPTEFKIVENRKFLPKVQSSLQNSLEKYESEEVFLLRNVAYNRTVLGAHVLQQKRYQTSPFMGREFLTFTLSLPENWKFRHRFYLEWLAKHCPEAQAYRWERTLLKPDAHWKTLVGDQFVKRGFKILNDRILKTPKRASMYPYQFYFENSSSLQKYYQDYFEANIYRLEAWPELRADVEALFAEPSFFPKSQAVSVLSLFKLFFKP